MSCAQCANRASRGIAIEAAAHGVGCTVQTKYCGRDYVAERRHPGARQENPPSLRNKISMNTKIPGWC